LKILHRKKNLQRIPIHIHPSQNGKFRQVRMLYAVEIDSQTTSTDESTTTDTAPSDSDERTPVIDFAFINASSSI
jgi:hypothetical protein